MLNKYYTFFSRSLNIPKETNDNLKFQNKYNEKLHSELTEN